MGNAFAGCGAVRGEVPLSLKAQGMGGVSTSRHGEQVRSNAEASVPHPRALRIQPLLAKKPGRRRRETISEIRGK